MLVVGGALIAVGAMLLVLPGPGTPVLFAGLALLATEFTWADRLLLRAKARMDKVTTWRPSRQAVSDTLAILGGCTAVVVTIAGLDELAGLLTT